MKRTQLLVVAVLAVGLHGVAQASPYPADAEASFDMSSLGAGAAWGVGKREPQGKALPYPADAEAHFDMSSLAGSTAPWGVSERESQPRDPFPLAVEFGADD